MLETIDLNGIQSFYALSNRLNLNNVYQAIQMSVDLISKTTHTKKKSINTAKANDGNKEY